MNEKASHRPKVSVVMAVYNGSRYLHQATDSILAQTWADFEFIIVNDGSTDATAQVLGTYTDPRIVRVENEANLGLTKSLNRGIAVARGELIARQDADDASSPERLALQVEYMGAHPAVGLVGAGSRWIDAGGTTIKEWCPLCQPDQIQQVMLSSVPFLHGTFLFRRDALHDIGGGYDESKAAAQDCDLLFRISERWDVANLDKILYVHRRHEQTITARQRSAQERFLSLARREAINRRLRYGWRRIGLGRGDLPEWVRTADRRWLARRYACWSAASRRLSRRTAVQFLLIALSLDPATPEIWSFLHGVLRRKMGLSSGRGPCL